MEPPPAGPRRQVLLVLGMHRGGTSATAGLLARLGARIPATPIRANRDNPHGYWESESLFRLHDRLLAEAGSAWDDWGPLDGARRRVAGGRAIGGAARAALAAAFTAEFERTMPRARGDEGPAHLPLPAALAGGARRRRGRAGGGAAAPPSARGRGLARPARRDGRGGGAAALAAPHARGRGRRPAPCRGPSSRYDDLVADWRAVADRLAATLGIVWPVAPEAAAGEIAAFLSGDLRHHAADPAAPLPAWAAEGWAALSALAARGRPAPCPGSTRSAPPSTPATR